MIIRICVGGKNSEKRTYFILHILWKGNFSLNKFEANKKETKLYLVVIRRENEKFIIWLNWNWNKNLTVFFIFQFAKSFI